MFLVLMEFCFGILILGFIVTQMIFPMYRGTIMFPIWRKEAKLENEIRQLNQKVIEKEMSQTIKNIKKEKGVN